MAPTFISDFQVLVDQLSQTVDARLGHADVGTTMVYTHVLQRGALGVRSPADGL